MNWSEMWPLEMTLEKNGNCFFFTHKWSCFAYLVRSQKVCWTTLQPPVLVVVLFRLAKWPAALNAASAAAGGSKPCSAPCLAAARPRTRQTICCSLLLRIVGWRIFLREDINARKAEFVEDMVFCAWCHWWSSGDPKLNRLSCQRNLRHSTRPTQKKPRFRLGSQDGWKGLHPWFQILT